MEIISETLTRDQLKEKASGFFVDMIKAVVDVNREVIAIDAELHSDLEALLLNNHSKQRNLWGINFYPNLDGEDFIEFDSMINLRPAQNNTTRGVDDAKIREKIMEFFN